MDTKLDAKEAVIEDLLYLTDELSALSNLIHSFPVYDRPPEGLSICETIRFIGYVQTVYRNNTFSSLSATESYDLLFEEFLKNRLPLETEKSKGITVFIEELISDRTKFVLEIRNSNMTDDSVQVLSELVAIDRLILKDIADIILSMEQSK